MSLYQHGSFREFTCLGSANFRRPPAAASSGATNSPSTQAPLTQDLD